MLLPPLDLTDGTLIQIGAGTAPGLEARLAAGGSPARVVLVEPHPQLARALTARLGDLPEVSVLVIAIGADDRTSGGDLHLFSDRAHCSLRPGLPLLHQLLPGLKAEGVLPVVTQSAGQLFASLGDLPRPVQVEIDAPGSARDILNGLKSAGCLQKIDMIDLRTAAEPLYDGAAGSAEIATWLQAEGFLIQRTEITDPDWPELRAATDWPRRALDRELAGLRDETTAQGRRIAALESDLAASEATGRHQDTQLGERASQIAALEADLQQTAQQVADKEWRLGELRSELETARQAGDEGHQRIGELEQTLAAERTRAQEQETLARDRASRIGVLETTLDAASQTAAQQTSRLAETDSALARSTTEAKAAEEAQAAAEATLAELQTAHGVLRQDFEARTAELDKAEQLAAGMADLQAETARLRAELATATTAREMAEAKVAEQTGLTAARQAKVAELETALAAAQAQVKVQTDLAAARQTKVGEMETALAAAQAQTKAQTDLAAARQTKVGELETSLAAAQAQTKTQTDLAADRQAKVGELEAALSAAQGKFKEQADLAASRQTKVAELKSANAVMLPDLEAKSKALAEAEKKSVRLTEVESELAKAKANLADKDAVVKLSNDRRTRIETLEQRASELEHKLIVARKELNRAEGQIKLISDLLLRGGGL